MSRQSFIQAPADRAEQFANRVSIGLSALESLPQAVAVLDRYCRVQYVNSRAESLRAFSGPCRMPCGYWQFRQPDAQDRLAQLVQNVCVPGRSTTVGGGFRMQVDEGAELLVSVLPLKAHHPHASFSRPAPLALVFIVASQATAFAASHVIADQLGLTATEARLAASLAAGNTVLDFAAVQRCTPHTARSHLKNLMRKTGCRRQLDVVRLVQSLQVG